MKLGIFDSGKGGDAIAITLRAHFPHADITTINDHDNVPYGNRSDEEILRLTEEALRPLLDGSYDVIILACNTVSAVAVDALRTRHAKQKFIALEPMVKPAASLTKSNTIAVCATPATLRSAKYNRLIERYGGNLTILEPDCRNWAAMIETNTTDNSAVAEIINNACNEGADVIVLGCTHYIWIKELIQEIAGDRAIVIEPSEAIARRVGQLLELG